MSKFICNRNALHNALSTTGKAINQNAIIPAFSNYLFDITKDTLTVCACNGETFISQHFPIDSDIEVKLQLPSKKLFDWISTLSDQPLTFIIKESTIQIVAGDDKCSMAFDSGEDYPFPQADTGEGFTIDGSSLIDGINKTVFCAANDTQESYDNVSIEFGGKSMTFTATNKIVFSTWSYPVESDLVADILLAPSALSIVQSCMFGAPVKVSIGKMITFTLMTGIVIKCSLVNKKFIDYKPMISKVFDNVVHFNRSELIGALKRSSIFSNDVTKLVDISIGKKQTTLCGKDVDLARDSESVLPSGCEPLDICVNGNLFIQCLSKLDTDDVYIEVRSPKEPLYIKSINAPKTKQNFMILLPYAL